MTLRIFDARNLLVREIRSRGPSSAGVQELTWDGEDQAGRRVPPEAYHYTLVVRDEAGIEVEHDVTDLTGGELLAVPDATWNSDRGAIEYDLPKSARLNMRIGLKGDGPMLGTLLDWVPRLPGRHSRVWDGKDASRVLDLREHPELRISILAYSLPDNTILVLPPSNRSEWIAALPWGETRRLPKAERPRRMYDFAAQAAEDRRDVSITLVPAEPLARTEDGDPIVRGPIGIRMDVEDRDRARMQAERFETVFYVNGSYQTETELGFLPATWVWDPGSVAEGIHYITGNLRGYEGHFGAATLRVFVDPGGTR
ncbi:MAG: hypothetical protein OZ948_18420 [Deltaproteobacteria bacterium]|nr:hypothetical protein [Deltaproteobacteria bacterium]